MALVVEKLRNVLTNLQLAINGEVQMTDELQTIMIEIFEAKPPKSLLFTAAGTIFSWINSTIGLWMGTLSDRDTQFRKWLNSGRPNVYWLGGFSNPQGFFTSMKQEVTRKHKSDGWALDDVIYHTEVTEFERAETVRSAPKEGVYCCGLSIDGAAWSRHENTLIESPPKILFSQLPVLYVTGTTKQLRKDHIRGGAYGPAGPYESPMYIYPIRQDRYFICMVSLGSRGVDGRKDPPSKNFWIMRGVALLTSTDYI